MDELHPRSPGPCGDRFPIGGNRHKRVRRRGGHHPGDAIDDRSVHPDLEPCGSEGTPDCPHPRVSSIPLEPWNRSDGDRVDRKCRPARQRQKEPELYCPSRSVRCVWRSRSHWPGDRQGNRSRRRLQFHGGQTPDSTFSGQGPSIGERVIQATSFGEVACEWHCEDPPVSMARRHDRPVLVLHEAHRWQIRHHDRGHNSCRDEEDYHCWHWDR